jgi:hypothetical protein
MMLSEKAPSNMAGKSVRISKNIEVTAPEKIL